MHVYEIFFCRKIIYVLLIPFVLLLYFATTADRVNFSAEWKIEEPKSDLGDFTVCVTRSLKAALYNGRFLPI